LPLLKSIRSNGIIGASEGKNSTRDYDVYIMRPGEKAVDIVLADMVLFAAGFVFYRNAIFSLLLCPLAFLYPRLKTREIIKKRKRELNIQFRDMLYALSTSLSAGKSVETAFRDVQRDLSVLYPDPETDIIWETEHIVRRLELNENIEDILADFARRSHIEDIENFADVFQTCKRTGGNIVEVIRNTSNVISDKIEIMQEIDTMLAERKLEQKVLTVLPVLIILLLQTASWDYIQPVYTTGAGRVVMSLSLLLLGLSYIISRRITDISV